MDAARRRDQVKRAKIAWKERNRELAAAGALCSKCGSNPRQPIHSWCGECNRENARTHYAKRMADPVLHERERLRGIERQRREREAVIAAYGGKCECCETNEMIFLVIDHINGDGNLHRAEVGRKGVYRDLRRRGYPPGFRVLCHNCNWAEHLLGGCPHKGGPSS